MKYLQVLRWLRDNDYAVVVYPAESLGDGCCSRQEYHLTELLIEAEVATPRDSFDVREILIAGDRDTFPLTTETAEYFVEVAPSMAGEMTAYVYRYPKPDGLVGDVSIARTIEESVLPGDRRDADRGPGYFLLPYEFVGTRASAS